ncbi:MAG: DUF4340 domain-containing protein [Oscillospiraceae bacterium]|jgi:hypothetical protein|nr:DUF4340 domain-containing protein [Oscillospiraceae bacterium]
MKITLKNILILAAVVVLLGCAALWLFLSPVKGEETTTGTSVIDKLVTPKLTNFNQYDIAEIEVQNDKSEIIITCPANESGVFGILGGEAYAGALDTDKLSITEQGLRSLAVIDTVEKNPTDLAVYSLAEPLATVTITLRDGSSVKLSVGMSLPDGSATYVMKDGDDTVYTIAKTATAYLTERKEFFYSTTLTAAYDQTSPILPYDLHFSGSAVTETDITAIRERFGGDRSNGIGMYQMNEPYEFELDTDAASALMFGFYGLNAAGVVKVGATDADRDKWLLTSPTVTTQMTDNEGKTVGLTIGGVSTDALGNVALYCEYSEYPGVVYLIEQKNLPWLTPDYTKLAQKSFAMPSIYAVSRIEAAVGDKRLSFTLTSKDKDDDTLVIKMNGKEQDKAYFKKLYGYLIGIKAETLAKTTEKVGMTKVGDVAFYLTSGDKLDIVLYESPENENRYIVEFGGVMLYEVRKAYLEGLQKNIAAYETGGEILTRY